MLPFLNTIRKNNNKLQSAPRQRMAESITVDYHVVTYSILRDYF